MDESEDYAQYLSGQAQSDVASLHQFMILFDEADGAVHVFFEGDEDPPFYLPPIRAVAGGRPIRAYICGGKKSVISVRGDIRDRGYSTEGCLFFVDRDYDDFLGSQGQPDDFTYITDHYSIESDLVGDAQAEIILADVIGMSPVDPEYGALRAAISRALEEFTVALKPWSAWAIASKEAGEKPNFNNINLARVLSISATGEVARQPKAFSIFRHAIKKDTSVSRKAVLKWRRVIRGEGAKRWLRGKYELWAFETVLIVVLQDLARRRKSAGARPPRIPSAIRERALFDLLGGRIVYPPSLTSFINRRIGT